VVVFSGCFNPLGDILGSAEIRLKYGTTEIRINESFDFSDIEAGSAGEIYTFVIENGGKSDLELPTGIKISGANSAMFVIVSQPQATVLSPGESAVFEIRFQPTGAAGLKSATVTISTNDAAIGTFVFTITGTCLVPSVDTTRPSVVISSTASGITATSPIPVTITFSEYVNGFTISDVTVSGGSKGNFVSSANPVFTFDITPPSSPATITVNVAENVALDAAGNGNTAAAQFTVVYNTAVPTVTISTQDAKDPTNSSPIVFVITFSEMVEDFDETDVTVTNGSKGFTSTSDDTVCTLAVTPGGDGLVTASVAAGVATSVSTDFGNAAATPFSVTYDGTHPTVTIASDVGYFSAVPAVPLTITFSEPVTDFTVGDLSVVNATAGTLATSDNTVYTVTVTAEGSAAEITVNIAADAAFDAAGNGNAAAAQLAVTYNSNLPTVTINSSAPDPTNLKPFPVDIVFSEAMSGFTLDDITVGNGFASNFVDLGGDTAFTADITASSDGEVTVDIAAGVAVSTADSLPNAAATQLSRNVDSTRPGVAITSTLSGLTGASSIPITVTFTEVVTGFEAADLSVSNNGAVANFTDEGDGVYAASISTAECAEGTITANIAEGATTAAAGNTNTPAAQWSIEFSASATTVAISSTSVSDPTNDSPIEFIFTFSEAVNGFESDDISVTNGTKGSIMALTANIEFSLLVTPVADGLVAVGVLADSTSSVSHGTGNVAASFSITYDGTAPEVAITSTETDPTSAAFIPITVTFDEPVVDFTDSDLLLSNGGVVGFADAGGGMYTASIDTSGSGADGTITVDISSGVAHDVAGNGNTAATQWTIAYDGAPPDVAITSTETGPTSAALIPITVTFSETVIGFEWTDLQVSSGSAVNLTDEGGGVYTALIDTSEIVADVTITVDIAAGAAFDAAGNGNTATPQFSIEFVNFVTIIAELYYLDGGSWRAEVAPPEGTISVAADGNGLVALDVDGGIYRLESGWAAESTAAPADAIDLAFRGGVLFALESSGGIEYLDGGAWRALSTTPPEGTIDIAGSASVLYALTDAGVVYYLDGGAWRNANAPFSGALAIAVVDGDLHLLAGTLGIYSLSGGWESTGATAPAGSVDVTGLDGTLFVLVN